MRLGHLDNLLRHRVDHSRLGRLSIYLLLLFIPVLLSLCVDAGVRLQIGLGGHIDSHIQATILRLFLQFKSACSMTLRISLVLLYGVLHFDNFRGQEAFIGWTLGRGVPGVDGLGFGELSLQEASSRLLRQVLCSAQVSTTASSLRWLLGHLLFVVVIVFVIMLLRGRRVVG